MKRIDRLAVRIAALTAKQDAEQNWPRFVLHLSDGSTAELVARLPEALVKLAELHKEGCAVLSVDKPEQVNSLANADYELYKALAMGGVPVSDARTALLYADDSYLLPPEEPTEDEAISERNHNLI